MRRAHGEGGGCAVAVAGLEWLRRPLQVMRRREQRGMRTLAHGEHDAGVCEARRVLDQVGWHTHIAGRRNLINRFAGLKAKVVAQKDDSRRQRMINDLKEKSVWGTAANDSVRKERERVRERGSKSKRTPPNFFLCVVDRSCLQHAGIFFIVGFQKQFVEIQKKEGSEHANLTISVVKVLDK